MLEVLKGGNNRINLSKPLLLQMSEIPEIEQYLFHKMEAWKTIFKDQLQELDLDRLPLPDGDNIISINRDEFLSMTPSTRLKKLFYYLSKYPFLEEIVCERFFSLILPTTKDRLDEEDRKKTNFI
jgi:hypothetical protein